MNLAKNALVCCLLLGGHYVSGALAVFSPSSAQQPTFSPSGQAQDDCGGALEGVNCAPRTFIDVDGVETVSETKSKCCTEGILINSLNAIRVLAGTKNSRFVGFYSRNSTKRTVNPNTTIHKYDHHGGAVCHSYGVGSMDPPDRTRVTSSEGVGRGGWLKQIIKNVKLIELLNKN